MQMKVEGMTCGHCEKAVTAAIAALGGTAQVDLANGTVDVAGIDDAAAAAVRRAIEDAGYAVVETVAPASGKGCCGST